MANRPSFFAPAFALPQRVTPLWLFGQACWISAVGLLMWGFVMEVRGGSGALILFALAMLANASFIVDSASERVWTASEKAVVVAAIFGVPAALGLLGLRGGGML